MAQTKKKTSSKTTKKSTAAKTTRKAATRTANKRGSKEISNTERMHVYIVTALSFIAVILLCADAAMINLS